ncbi:MAG: hypothetical protein AB1758_19900 [Candidatus Eremiobacterota bacterium]
MFALVVENLATSLRAGTTQALLLSDFGAVLASDRAQRLSNDESTLKERSKIVVVRSRVIVGISGTCALIRSDGTVIDLQDSVPPVVGRYEWDNPELEAKQLSAEIGLIVSKLEAGLFLGTPDPTMTPQVTVLLSGVSQQEGTFGVRLRYPGTYIPDDHGYRLSFTGAEPEILRPRPGSAIALVETRQKSVERAAMDLIAGREQNPKYPVLAGFRQRRPDLAVLRETAEELVRVTADLDERIGRTIDVLAVPAIDPHVSV